MKYNKNFYQIKSNTEIFERINAERESVGYYNLPYQDTTEIKNYAHSINKKHIIVLGIGGSSLGARAIYEFLLPSANYSKDLLFLETIDPLKINYCLKKVDLNDSQFVVISKSGNTIETISIFKYLNSLVEINSSNCTIISESKSNLTQFAKDNNIQSFDLARSKLWMLLSLANCVRLLLDSEMIVQLELLISTKEFRYLNILMVSMVLPDFEITTNCESFKSTFFKQ